MYGKPSRDPRGHAVSIVYLARGSGILAAADDAKGAGVFMPEGLPELWFSITARLLPIITLLSGPANGRARISANPNKRSGRVSPTRLKYNHSASASTLDSLPGRLILGIG